jgi:hypothetical protein
LDVSWTLSKQFEFVPVIFGHSATKQSSSYLIVWVGRRAGILPATDAHPPAALLLKNKQRKKKQRKKERKKKDRTKK